MSKIQENLIQLREEFAELEDGFERYSYIVELAALLPPYPEAHRTPAHLVRGCQSQVWVHSYTKNGLLYFDADSDTLIIKGALLVLHDLFNGVTLHEVAEVKLDIFDELGLTSLFSDDRQKGIRSAVEILKKYAQNQLRRGLWCTKIPGKKHEPQQLKL